MSEIKDFKDLIIWQKGMDIAQKCYYITKSFPKEELMNNICKKIAAEIRFSGKE
jgi:hypothetical protein